MDDEEGIRKVLGITLSDMGYDVYTAHNGKNALEVFRKISPSIVLTDIRMPGIDGVELLGKIKEESPDVEVIMISGHGDMDLAIKSLQRRVESRRAHGTQRCITFPAPPLKFRTLGFPQYGFKLEFSYDLR